MKTGSKGENTGLAWGRDSAGRLETGCPGYIVPSGTWWGNMDTIWGLLGQCGYDTHCDPWLHWLHVKGCMVQSIISKIVSLSAEMCGIQRRGQYFPSLFPSYYLWISPLGTPFWLCPSLVSSSTFLLVFSICWPLSGTHCTPKGVGLSMRLVNAGSSGPVVSQSRPQTRRVVLPAPPHILQCPALLTVICFFSVTLQDPQKWVVGKWNPSSCPL